MKQPQTSLDAYHSQTSEKLTADHQKIVDALNILGQSNYENIAALARMDRHAVGRRLKEMELHGLIYKPGTKSFLKSGRYGYDYRLTNPEKVDKKIEPKKSVVIKMPTLF